MARLIHHWTAEHAAQLIRVLERSPSYKETPPEQRLTLEMQFLLRAAEMLPFFTCFEGKLGKVKKADIEAVDVFINGVGGLPDWYLQHMYIIEGADVSSFLDYTKQVVADYNTYHRDERRHPIAPDMKFTTCRMVDDLCNMFDLNFTGTEKSDAARIIKFMCQCANLECSPTTAKHLIDNYKKQLNPPH